MPNQSKWSARGIMDISSIAGLSIQMHMDDTMFQANVAITKKALDAQSVQALALIEDLTKVNPVSFGHQLDILV